METAWALRKSGHHTGIPKKMSVWEKLGFKKKETPEQTRKKQIQEKIKEIMLLEKRLENFRRNVEGSSVPGDTTRISIMEEQLIDLNKELEKLGGKPLGTYALEQKAREGGFIPQGKKP